MFKLRVTLLVALCAMPIACQSARTDRSQRDLTQSSTQDDRRAATVENADATAIEKDEAGSNEVAFDSEAPRPRSDNQFASLTLGNPFETDAVVQTQKSTDWITLEVDEESEVEPASQAPATNLSRNQPPENVANLRPRTTTESSSAVNARAAEIQTVKWNDLLKERSQAVKGASHETAIQGKPVTKAPPLDTRTVMSNDRRGGPSDRTTLFPKQPSLDSKPIQQPKQSETRSVKVSDLRDRPSDSTTLLPEKPSSDGKPTAKAPPYEIQTVKVSDLRDRPSGSTTLLPKPSSDSKPTANAPPYKIQTVKVSDLRDKSSIAKSRFPAKSTSAAKPAGKAPPTAMLTTTLSDLQDRPSKSPFPLSGQTPSSGKPIDTAPPREIQTTPWGNLAGSPSLNVAGGRKEPEFTPKSPAKATQPSNQRIALSDIRDTPSETRNSERAGSVFNVPVGETTSNIQTVASQKPIKDKHEPEANRKLSVENALARSTQNPIAPILQPTAGEQDEPPIDLPAVLTPEKEAPPVSLHLDDVSIRKALELLSRQGNLNILVAPGVTGNVSADFENVTLEEAFQALLKLANLVASRDGNLVYVYTQQELAALDTQSGRVGVRIYHLNYVRAADVETMITPFLSTDFGSMSVTPASETGIKTDIDMAGGDSLAGGEAIVVRDYEAVLDQVDDIIQQLDVRPVQVVIEAVIMEVILDEDCELGVNFAVLDGAGKALLTSGNGSLINAAAGFTPASVLTAGGKLQNPINGTAFAANEHGVKFGFVDDDVTGFIRALTTAVNTEILASPRILVLNKQRAELIIGERIGYKTLTVTQTGTVEDIKFLNVGTQLRLRPFVTQEGLVRMEIHPERSTGQVVEGVPRTRTNELTTNVIVPNGATIVLAGLIETEKVTSRQEVPGLGRLPYVGALFRNKKNESLKKEVIVLLTPKIWDPAAAAAGMCDPSIMPMPQMLPGTTPDLIFPDTAPQSMQPETAPELMQPSNVLTPIPLSTAP